MCRGYLASGGGGSGIIGILQFVGCLRYAATN
jgi:hypothetical protein